MIIQAMRRICSSEREGVNGIRKGNQTFDRMELEESKVRSDSQALHNPISFNLFLYSTIK
jgi:hypothetical protein